ncbi:MAG: hypothetical protein PSU94_07050 [Lacunisphaera sp.]|nr:hypothetical protein [Lacunisphaera sp.]
MKSNSIRELFVSHGFGQVVTVILQLLQLPVLLRFWGMELTAAWFTLNAIPVVLNTSDLGIFTVLGNRILAQRLAGETAAALISRDRMLTVSSWGSIFVFSLGSAICLATILGSELALANAADAYLACLVIALNGAVGFWQNLQRTYLRMEGLLAKGTLHYNMQRLASFTLVMLVAFISKSLAAAAAVQLLSNLLVSSRLGKLYAARNWLLVGFRQLVGVLRTELRNCYAASAFTLSTAVLSQSFTIILAWKAGAAEVVAFNAYRILGRPAVQYSILIASSTWPRVAELCAAKDLRQLTRICRNSLLAYAGGATLGSLMLLLLAPWLWAFVTSGNLPLRYPVAILATGDAIALGFLNILFADLVAVGKFTRQGNILLLLTVVFLALAVCFMAQYMVGFILLLSVSSLATIFAAVEFHGFLKLSTPAPFDS